MSEAAQFQNNWMTTAMKRVFIAVLAGSGCSDESPPGLSYMVVTGPTHDCAKGPSASIEASGSEFKLTSTYERILIRGAGNRIAVEAAKRIDVDGAKNDIEVGATDVIRVNGTGNTIKYRNKGVTRAAPEVVAIGDNNSLIRLSD